MSCNKSLSSNPKYAEMPKYNRKKEVKNLKEVKKQPTPSKPYVKRATGAIHHKGVQYKIAGDS